MPTEKILAQHLGKLPAFLAVADCGSFSNAAATQGISQPALSVSIRTLERAVGHRLFIRHAKGVRLSETGHQLLKLVRNLWRACDDFDLSLARPEIALPKLRVGTKDPLAIHLWPDYARAFADPARKLNFDLLTHRSTTTLLSWLRQRKVDMVMIGNPAAQAGLKVYELFRSDYAAYAHPRAVENSALPCFVFSEALATERKTLGQLLGRSFYARHELRDLSSFEVARAMALSGAGTAILPRFIGERDVRAGHLVESSLLRGKKLGRLSVCACFREDDTRALFLRKLAHRLRDVHHSLAKNPAPL